MKQLQFWPKRGRWCCVCVCVLVYKGLYDYRGVPGPQCLRGWRSCIKNKSWGCSRGRETTKTLLYILPPLIWRLGEDGLIFSFVNLFFFLVFLGPHWWHMEVPGLGVKLELQLQTYAAATATWDLSCICDLYHSSWQCQIPDSLSQTRDGIRILMD